jgi:hypothetical protein
VIWANLVLKEEMAALLLADYLVAHLFELMGGFFERGNG